LPRCSGCGWIREPCIFGTRPRLKSAPTLEKGASAWRGSILDGGWCAGDSLSGGRRWGEARAKANPPCPPFAKGGNAKAKARARACLHALRLRLLVRLLAHPLVHLSARAPLLVHLCSRATRASARAGARAGAGRLLMLVLVLMSCCEQAGRVCRKAGRSGWIMKPAVFRARPRLKSAPTLEKGASARRGSILGGGWCAGDSLSGGRRWGEARARARSKANPPCPPFPKGGNAKAGAGANVGCAGGATCHLPPATCYLLPATCYLLPATCYLLLATCYLLLATYDLRPASE